MSLSAAEQRMVLTLDQLCYEDSEEGGGGWASLIDITDAFDAGIGWTRRVLDFLLTRGMAERRRHPRDRRRAEFALTERGAEFARELDDAQPLPDSGGGE